MSLVSVGSGVLQWGWYETKRVLSWIPPSFLTAGIAYLAHLTTDTSTLSSVIIGAVASVILAVIKQAVTDNTKEKTT